MHAPHRLSGWSARLGCAVVCLVLTVSPAVAEDEAPPPPAPAGSESEPAAEAPNSPWPEGAVLGVVQGRRVNLRVGPRRDNHPVTHLDDGAVVVIVERAAEWLGVRVLGGFPVALSGKYAERVGESAIRIDASRLNLRAHPPEEGAPQPGAFRDRPERGEILPLISEESGWYWALAPEHVRAYIKSEFVQEIGPPAEHGELVVRGRAERDDRIGALVRSRRRAAIYEATEALRDVAGAAQQKLYRLRVEDGFDRTPIAKLADELSRAMEEHTIAAPGVMKIATTLHADLEAEIELRLARHDAEVAALRGLLPEPVAPLTPRRERVEVRGKIRWESAPKWRNGGVFILWIEEEPRYVLRLTTGVKGPLPDLAKNADGQPRTIRARQPGERVFGLPALDVLELRN